MLRTSCAIAVSVFVSVIGSSASFAQQPPGSYQQSCGNVRFDGVQLSAVCADRFGRRVPTSLMVRNCMGGISNNNGQLVCQAGGRGRDDGRWYEDDEDDYRPRRSRRDYGGDYREPRKNGYRGGQSSGPRMPGGSWHASCKNGQLQGFTVIALCANARGQFQQTSADVRSCASFANRNGNLSCE